MKHALGVIGYGTMGPWHCANVRDRIKGLDVAAVYDIDPARREAARKDGFAVYDTPEEFFRAPTDLVTVATPNNFHADYCKRAMKEGKNVISEKPACLDMEELDEVLAVAKETGKLYTVHQNRRFDVDYAIVRNIVEGKTLGNLFLLESRLYSNRGFAKGGWKAHYETGGGLLYDWGIHLLDQLLWLVKEEPVSVYADLHRVHCSDVDDVCSVTLCFKNGLTARFLCDLWCYVNEPRWHLQGDEGSAVVTDWFDTKGKIVKAKTVGEETSHPVIYTSNGLTSSLYRRPIQELEEAPLPVPEQAPRWEDFYENVMKAIEGKEAPIVTQQEIVLDMKVLMAAFESARRKQVVFL